MALKTYSEATLVQMSVPLNKLPRAKLFRNSQGTFVIIKYKILTECGKTFVVLK